MSRMVLPSYYVLRDSREKPEFGWHFSKQPETKKPPRCNGEIIQKLDTGDYSVVGLEGLLCIERKDDFAELWTNYSNRSVFENEMERMNKFKYKYMLIESILTKETMELSPPQFTKSVPGRALIGWLCGLSLKFGINIIPVGSAGKQYCQLIFQNVIRLEKNIWVPQNENE